MKGERANPDELTREEMEKMMPQLGVAMEGETR